MKTPPKNPQALTIAESNMLSKVSNFFDPYSGVINITSGIVTVVSAYVTYQQNKEIIKQLREINRKLDIVIKQLSALSSKLDEIQYKDRWDMLYADLNEIYLNESILDGNSNQSKILAEKLRTNLSISATYFLQLDPYFAFDYIGTVYGELLRLYEIVEVDNKNLKRQYMTWFSECLSEMKQSPKKSLNEQKRIIEEMEKTYKAGNYQIINEYGNTTETITYKVTGNIKTGFTVNQKVKKQYEHTDHPHGPHGLKRLENIAKTSIDPFSRAQELYATRMILIENLDKGISRIEEYKNT